MTLAHTNMDVHGRGAFIGGRVTDQQHFHAIGQFQPAIQPLVLRRFDQVIVCLLDFAHRMSVSGESETMDRNVYYVALENVEKCTFWEMYSVCKNSMLYAKQPNCFSPIIFNHFNSSSYLWRIKIIWRHIYILGSFLLSIPNAPTTLFSNVFTCQKENDHWSRLTLASGQ